MTVNFLRDNKLVIFETSVISATYRYDKLETDPDVIGVYVLPEEFILGGHGCSEYSNEGIQLSGTGVYTSVREKVFDIDCLYYELRHFLKLCAQGSPTAIQVLFAGKQHSAGNDEIWKMIYEVRKVFLTKKLKHSFGYSGLRILKYVPKPELDILDFYMFLSNSSTKVKSAKEHSTSNVRQAGWDADFMQLTRVRGDLYEVWYSQSEHYARRMGPSKAESPFDGLKLVEGRPSSRNLSDELKEELKLNKLGHMYFDQRGWELYNKTKPRIYSNKERARAYRYIKMAVTIAREKDLPTRFKMPLYADFVNSSNELKTLLLPDGEMITATERELESAFTEGDPLVNCVDSEQLNRLELQVRKRFELLSTIEQSHNG